MRRKKRKRRRSVSRKRVVIPKARKIRLSRTKLRRWSTLVRVREKFTCYLCGGRRKRWEMESHHIYPKACYPAKAYDLENGVCLCDDCHHRIIHHSKNSWRKFTCFFKRYVSRKALAEFNKKNKGKVHKR